MEPEKGSYNWPYLEANWGNISQTGKRVGFRVAAEIPGSGQNDTPQWLIDQGVEMRSYSIDGNDGFAPTGMIRYFWPPIMILSWLLEQNTTRIPGWPGLILAPMASGVSGMFG